MVWLRVLYLVVGLKALIVAVILWALSTDRTSGLYSVFALGCSLLGPYLIYKALVGYRNRPHVVQSFEKRIASLAPDAHDLDHQQAGEEK